MSNLVDSTSTTLIDRVKQQEPMAWQKLVQLYSPLVYSWCRKFGVPESDAADVFQEVFRSVHTHIGDFHKDQPGDAFRGWLWTITRNKIRDFFRRVSNHPQAIGGTDAMLQLMSYAEDQSSLLGDKSKDVSLSSLHLAGMEIVQAEFEDRTWQAFWRTTIDGVPPATAADELKISVNAVRLAKSRVLRRLREQLDMSDGA